jgi:hypothetical protein
VKSKVKGRGMAAVRQLMDIAESSSAPRLTLYNHEKELERLAALSACEAAERITREEGAYEIAAEQAWIAEQARLAEVERKKLADQEALNLLVDMGVHIATIETNKIKANQAAEVDFTMFDQNQNEDDADMGVGEDSSKGKKPIIVATPPCSPMNTDVPSTSSPIPPNIQAALNDIRDEIDELRVDVRSDMNSAIDTVHKKMDDMMLTLLKAIADVKKP